MIYQFTFSDQNLSQLDSEIRASSITVALDNVSRNGSSLVITFKASLSSGEETILGGLVSSHVPQVDLFPTTVSPIALPDPAGFRFRGNATPWTTCPPGQTNLEITLAEELHIDGGTIVVKDANPGDYCTFQVVHPLAGVVEQFVNKWFVIPGSGKMDVNVYRAKVPAGLKIRVVYNNEGSTDVECGINLRLHKFGI
jgi:hypothetical protein